MATKYPKISLFILFLFFFNSYSCIEKGCNSANTSSNTSNDTVIVKNVDLLNQINPLTHDGKINIVVEIPAGTTAKWQLDKSSGNIKWEVVNNKYRIVNYLAYPVNYGFVPGTILSKENGGDGDPLDAMILGSALERGEIVACDIIGVLRMLDNEEYDDKLIAITENSPFFGIQSIAELDEKFPGVSQIISTWFENYKGMGVVKVIGYEERKEAINIIEKAISEFSK